MIKFDSISFSFSVWKTFEHFFQKFLKDWKFFKLVTMKYFESINNNKLKSILLFWKKDVNRFFSKQNEFETKWKWKWDTIYLPPCTMRLLLQSLMTSLISKLLSFATLAFLVICHGRRSSERNEYKWLVIFAFSDFHILTTDFKDYKFPKVEIWTN